jgi:mersacidin/lichenicidin family type 2 lantibiotic
MNDKTAKSTQSSQHALGSLYTRYVLDRVVEVARHISHDFIRRPRQYRAVPENIAEILQGFRIRTGSDPAWLSSEQREVVLGAIFGRTFHASSTGIRSASVAYVDRGSGKSADLIEQVRHEAAVFRTYLKGIEGRAISMADKETGNVFQSAIEVIRSKEVAGVFGLAPVTEKHWPSLEAGKENGDLSAGANLIVEIRRSLGLTSAPPIVTPYHFIMLQRIAYYGALTMEGTLNETGSGSDDHTQELARNAYGWEKALQGLLSGLDVGCAWKALRYRQELSPFERTTLPPHPSGEIDLEGTQLDPAVAARPVGGMGFSTQTVGDEICCSTGDLYCPNSTQRTSHIECGGTTTIAIRFE